MVGHFVLAIATFYFAQLVSALEMEVKLTTSQTVFLRFLTYYLSDILLLSKVDYQ